MDGHSKREVLQIFNVNKKNVIVQFVFVSRPQIGHNLRFFVKWPRDISHD